MRYGNAKYCKYEDYPECIIVIRALTQLIENNAIRCHKCGNKIIFIDERRGTSDSPYPIDCDSEIIGINQDNNIEMRRKLLCEACLRKIKYESF